MPHDGFIVAPRAGRFAYDVYVTPTLVLVGGFLGAGKTTLLLAAGQRLRRMGKRVGIITNDQGGELVDTRFARAAGFDTA